MADPAYIVNGVLTDGEAWVGIGSHDFVGSETSLTITSTNDGQVGDFSQYMDLVVIAYVRFSSGGTTDGTLICEPNSDTYTGSNYQSQRFDGDGSSVTGIGWGGYMFVGIGFPGSTATANIYGAGILNIFDINSGKYKSAVSWAAGDQDGSGTVGLGGSTWKNRSPVTSTHFRASNNYTFAAGSRIDLFGVLPRMVS